MTPATQRMLFTGFGLMVVGVTVNVLLLQPQQGANRAALDPAQARVEAERRQKLALDKPAAAQGSATQAAAKVEADIAKPVETAKVDEPKPAANSGPPRATSGGPRPIAILPPLEQGQKRFARVLQPNAAHADQPADSLPFAPEAEGDPETIRAVQRELTAQGYGPLNSDGVPGLVTRAAIMAFEHDSRAPLTGEATEKVLSRLLLGTSGASAEADAAAAGRVRSAHAEIVMRTVQQSLAALGYKVGKIDGRAGDDTERAIREFESDEGLDQRGRVSAEVFSRLGRAVATARPQPVR
jgi:peptidoglycan hydrolase-like protein with peptidoglycan-binding domain